MSKDKTDYRFLIDLVEMGELDDIIEAMADAVRARREFLKDMRGAANRAEMAPGTKVRVFDIRPKYLNGITGVVSERRANRQGDLMVEVDPSCYARLGRYGKVLGIPASSLEEIA